MSIRRRNIQTRLSRDLELERGHHRLTRGLLEVRGKLIDQALNERDAARRERDRLKDLAVELASYFNSDPPASLSRETDLFLLLQEVAPGFIRPLPPTPTEVFESLLSVVAPELMAIIDGASDSANLQQPTGE